MKKRAFTLAEMMVVMLILTIVLAAFAPMMTKRRSEGSGDNPWKWAVNNIDAYFGLSANQTAMIGQKEKASGDPNVKLLINSDAGSHIAFKSGDTIKASFSTTDGLRLTGPYSASNPENVTAFGSGALSQTSSSNTAFGFNALSALSSGTSNVAIGANAIKSASSGTGNVAVGDNTFNNVTSPGNYNTALGYQACQNVTGGSNITCLGANSGPTTGTSTSNVIYLGSSTTTAIYSNTSSLTTYSDKRLKNIKGGYTYGLEQVRELNPVNFVYKDDKNKNDRVGLIAQDVQKVLPDAVDKNSDGYLVIKNDRVQYAVLNAVKQLDKLVQGLIGEVKNILVKLQTHDEEIQKLKKENQELKERLEKLEKALS